MERLRKSTASSILALLLTALLPSSSLGVARFDQYHVNPAIVPMPVVYSYADCIARYGFCICTLTGLEQGEMDRFLADYDEDNDGKFNWLEIKRIQDEGIWKEQYYTDQQYLACRYDPPAPGPYEIQECERLFGAGDCVCSGMGDTIVCYGRAVTELSPEPMKVDRAFCLPYNPGGFDCTCTSPDRLLASAEASTCFVNSHDDEVDYECLEEVRIFPGRPYDCVASGFWADKCCPADLDCEIDEYDPGFNTGLALSATNTVLKTYIAYQGYAAGTTGAHTQPQFLLASEAVQFLAWHAGAYICGRPYSFTTLAIWELKHVYTSCRRAIMPPSLYLSTNMHKSALCLHASSKSSASHFDWRNIFAIVYSM